MSSQHEIIRRCQHSIIVEVIDVLNNYVDQCWSPHQSHKQSTYFKVSQD